MLRFENKVKKTFSDFDLYLSNEKKNKMKKTAQMIIDVEFKV